MRPQVPEGAAPVFWEDANNDGALEMVSGSRAGKLHFYVSNFCSTDCSGHGMCQNEQTYKVCACLVGFTGGSCAAAVWVG